MKEDKREIPGTDDRLLVGTKDQVESAIITDILGQNGVASYQTPRGLGTLDAYVGQSVYGDYVYVNKADLERARELLKEVLPAEMPQE